MAIDLLIRNATLVTVAGRRDSDIAIAGGRFTAIDPAGTSSGAAAETIDATGLIALPGVIDGHVHFREPGLEHEEAWLTGTRAAVMGGVTTVLDMPNTVPPTDTEARARAKLELAAASAHCDFGLFGLIGPAVDHSIELADSGLVVGLKVFMGPTTGGLAGPDDAGLRRALSAARDSGLRVAFHAEDRAIIESREAALRAGGRTDARAHRDARPPEAEVVAIERACSPLAETGAAGHILHLSSADGLAAVERWRAAGVDVTCEVTPHHALLEDDAYGSGSMAKVNPPIRGGRHASVLRAALADGRIDGLASDHAPHRLGDKERDSIWDAAAGFAGVETLLPLLLTEVAAGLLSLERLAYLTSQGPARAWGLWPRKGAVALGSDADLTLVDINRPGAVRADALHGLNNHSPFEGRATIGAPVTTIVRGRIVVRDGALVAEPGTGRAVSRP